MSPSCRLTIGHLTTRLSWFPIIDHISKRITIIVPMNVNTSMGEWYLLIFWPFYVLYRPNIHLYIFIYFVLTFFSHVLISDLLSFVCFTRDILAVMRRTLVKDIPHVPVPGDYHGPRVTQFSTSDLQFLWFHPL